MKIGIITFHNVPNYGAIMQAYALYHTIKNMGYDVDIIDYRGNGNNDVFSPQKIKESYYHFKGLHKLVNRLRYIFFVKKDYELKYVSFQTFRNQYFTFASCTEIAQYKYLFYGSDQIWNPRITKGFDKILFAEGSKSKNISYAASVGSVNNIYKEEYDQFFKLLRNFSAISVRENSLKTFIENNCELPCSLVVDPVFLLSKNDYIELIEKTQHRLLVNLPQRYLLLYQLQQYPAAKKLAKVIAAKKKLEIVELCGCINGWYSNKRVYNDCGPLEFIYLLMNAGYVITNSFHGTAFSILFNKDFNVVESRTGSERIFDLLKLSGLTERLFKENQNNFSCEPINYRDHLGELLVLKKISLDFIMRSIGENE